MATKVALKYGRLKKNREDKGIIVNSFFIVHGLLLLLCIYGVPTTGEPSRLRETPQSSLLRSWPCLVFSLAVQPAICLTWREAGTSSVSQEPFIITSQRAESVSVAL